MMKILLIADSFPPEKNSASVQLRDLADELSKHCDELTVLLPSSDITCPVETNNRCAYHTIKLKVLPFKNINLIWRAINEFLMPFLMIYRLIFFTKQKYNFDLIIWYSPSIFHGPLVAFLKWKSKAKCYLIIRDIFPEWAVDLGLMSKGIPYFFFKLIANFQYAIADVIAVQTNGNKSYFNQGRRSYNNKIHVLENWLATPKYNNCSIDFRNLSLTTQKIAVYAGNMGIAQNVEVLLDLAQKCLIHRDITFLFVGRGSEVKRLQNLKNKHNLHNVYFFDEIDPYEIPALYKNCTVGLLALSDQHKTHNIPGKFISYMQAGLPCFGVINSGNDLVNLVNEYGVGSIIDEHNPDFIYDEFIKFLYKSDSDKCMSERCQTLFEERYHVSIAASQIMKTIYEK